MNKWKYQIPVIFTNHSKGNLERFAGVSLDYVKSDIQKNIFSLRIERGSDRCKIFGDLGNYIISIKNKKIIVITMLFRKGLKKKNKSKLYFGREYLNPTKKEIIKLINS